MEFFIAAVAIIALIVVHEFGHFVVAKWSGMRVDEFGIGFPPRALTIAKIGDTEYTLNWLPLGGFVKIYGEDLNAKVEDGVGTGQAFTDKNRFLQALVLVAGVAMNLLFAYVLITGALIAGTPRALSDSEFATAKNVELAVANVLPGSPAAQAGLSPGDVILSADDGHNMLTQTTPSEFTKFISLGGSNKTITLSVRHADGKEDLLFTRPIEGLIASDPSRPAIGVEVANIGVVPLSLGSAIIEGASLTWGVTKLTAVGLWHFFYGVFTFSADLSQVAGPVGIVIIVGAASVQGMGYLLSLLAIISVSLALINLIPIPALDGGRLLFVIIESIIRRPIKARIANAINIIAFALLIPLMLVVTASDIFRIVG